jgi:hypothetical protein
MNKYLVVFKDLSKQLNVESQDEATAKEWAQKQLSKWGKQSRFNVTAVVETKPTAQTDTLRPEYVLKDLKQVPAEKRPKRKERKA